MNKREVERNPFNEERVRKKSIKSTEYKRERRSMKGEIEKLRGTEGIKKKSNILSQDPSISTIDMPSGRFRLALSI